MPGNSSNLSQHQKQTSFENVKKETYRLNTFLTRALENRHPDPCQLARHGFYFTGYKNRLKCFSCQATKGDWSTLDNPRLKKWHSRSCALVLGTEIRNQPILGDPILFENSEESSTSSATKQSQDKGDTLNSKWKNNKNLRSDVRNQQRVDAAPSRPPRMSDAALSRPPKRSDVAPSRPPRRSDRVPCRPPRRSDAPLEDHLSLKAQRASDASTSGLQTSSLWSDSSSDLGRLNISQRRDTRENSSLSALRANDPVDSETESSSYYTAASTSRKDTEGCTGVENTPVPSVNNTHNCRFEKRNDNNQQNSSTMSNQLEEMEFPREQIHEAIRQKGRQATLNQLLDHLVLQNQEIEKASFFRNGLRSESTVPVDPPPDYSYIPNTVPGPMTMTMSSFGEQPVSGLCTSSASGDDESGRETRVGIVRMDNPSPLALREAMMTLFQDFSSKK